MQKSYFLMRTLLYTAAIMLCSCTSVADMAGYDSHTMNQNAQKQYTAFVGKARQAGVLDTTSPTAKQVMRVFNRMKPVAEAANQTGVAFNWQMNVIRTDEINAWAMPGGKMAVYTGLVNKLNLSDDELAAVIGHEMSHALQEHSKKEAGQKILTGVLTQVAGNIVGAYTGMDASVIGMTGSLVSDLGVDRPYSRHQENQADAGGLYLMARAGYNPQAAITVWEKMNAANRGGSNAASALLSTHPANAERIANLRKALPSVMPIYQQNRR